LSGGVDVTRRPRASAEQPSLHLPQPEGVHLRLPEEQFADASAIGWTDLKVLYWQAETWWFQSPYNLRRRVKLKSARRLALDLDGALRALVLSGEAAYRSRFLFEPDETSTHWIRNQVQLKAALERMGANVRGVYGEKLFSLARSKGIAHKVWDLAWVDFETLKRQGRPYIRPVDDQRIRYTAGLITEHPTLGPALRDGLTEVTVFWRRPEDAETLMRARFDKLRLERILDLKSLSNWRGRDLNAAIAETIETNDYGIQRRLYGGEAFDALCRFVREGRVFAYDAEGQSATVLSDERDYLRRIVEADRESVLWVWVFAQLRSDAFGEERAPVIAPRAHRPAGRIWDDAGAKIEAALEAFRRLRTEHSLERPWARVEEVSELVDSDVRSRTKKDPN
jgi:hypothetical protein